MSAKVLVVEDDPVYRKLLKESLEWAGYGAVLAENAAEGLARFKSDKPDLVVLDVRLPDGSGMDVCRRMREHKALAHVPVIMLTGAARKFEEKKAGFEAGADHYLLKPVPAKEVLLWVESLLRRIQMEREPGEVLEAGDLRLELAAYLASFKGKTLSGLTPKEFELLAYLVRHRPKVLGRKHILTDLWHTVTVEHVVDTHISNLRKKVPAALSERIQAVSGRGFRYSEDGG